ncbi:MAG: flagellar biosynthesis anti-sigma factor FlgM [Roseburia sp.]
MRIEAYNQIASVYKSNSSVKTQKTAGVAGRKDQVQISQIGRDYQIAKQAVAEASDIREDKVAELKTSVQSGNYHVDSGDFASVLLEKYNAR